LGARQKLNQAALNTALVVAALVGILTGSWLWAVIGLAVCIAAGLRRRDIRLGPDRRRRRR